MKNKSIFKILSVVLVATLLVGCGCKNNKKDNDNNKEIEEVVNRYVESVEKRVVINSMNNTEEDDIKEGKYTVQELTDKKVVLKEKIPNSGWVEVSEDGKVVDYSLVVDSYTAIKDGSKIKITK